MDFGDPLWQTGAYAVAFVLLIYLAIAAVAAMVRATSRPKPEELAALERTPGERYIDYRVANALIRDAKPNFVFENLFDFLGGNLLAAGVSRSLVWVGRMTGGLWVGGRVFLTTHRIVFEPNALNRAVTSGIGVIVLNLAEVTAIERRGIVAWIIDVKTASGTLSLRCGRAQVFVAAIQNARVARQ